MLEYNKLSLKKYEADSKIFYADMKRKLTLGLKNNSSQISFTLSGQKDTSTVYTRTSLDDEQLEPLKNKLTSSALVVQTITFFFFSLFLSVALSLLACTFGSGDECFRSFAYPSDSMYVAGVLVVLVFCFIVYLHKMTKELPDPYGLQKENKLALIVPIFFISTDILINLVLCPPALNSKITVQQQLPRQLGFLVSYFIQLVYPLRVILQNKNLSRSLITLQTVLSSTHGVNLFRAYLIHEISVENLNFYLVAKIWKTNFYIDGISKSKRSARNIIHRWIEPNNDRSLNTAQVNVGYKVVKSILRRYKSEDFGDDLFDEAIHEAYRLMVLDSFPRFQRTREFKEYFAGKDPSADNETL
eukprot:snap_masked-scaffold_19-processed-gene-1.30-mRNA-1 protein AED:1.00 eAED:1.00 QI:0/-1/0/0/-1/1/1/0/357